MEKLFRVGLIHLPFTFFTLLSVSCFSQTQLWGVSQGGGTDELGTVFNLLEDGNGFAVSSSFTNNPDGQSPKASLIEGSPGTFFGLTSTGGELGGGTFFEYESGSFNKLFDLDPDVHGANAETDILKIDNNTFILATSGGGPNGSGVLLEVNVPSGITVLHNFDFATGGSPSGSIAYDDVQNVIYGGCASGGVNSAGTVFKYDLENEAFEVIHEFAGLEGGSFPRGGLTLADDGNLYGTTQIGGEFSEGLIFSINPNTNEFSEVYSLSLTEGDGRNPFGRLIQTEMGMLLGTCSEGGQLGTGTIFSCTLDGTFTRLHSFNSGIDGGFVKTGLTDGEDGFFYGVAEFGGSNGFGTVYRISELGSYELIHALDFTEDGSNPVGALLLASDGTFMGNSTSGGSGTFGTLFTLNEGVIAKLHDFSLPVDGAQPVGLIPSGNQFIGVTSTGGEENLGAIFISQLNGEKTKIHDFNGADGQNPNAGIIEGSDGFIYGTARFGGDNSAGTVFRLSQSGDFELLHSFDGSTNGQFPAGGLLEHSDGNFYGTTAEGGSFEDGILFRITSDGTFEKLHDLFGFFDGENPQGNLVEGEGGLIYGVTEAGGSFNGGTIFEFNTETQVLTALEGFQFVSGISPNAGLLLHSDQMLYGTTTEGANGSGSLFRYNLSTGLETLHIFDSNDGVDVKGALVEDVNGVVFGFAEAGGTFSIGTAFLYSDDSGFNKIFDFSFDGGQFPSGSPALFYPECFENGDCPSSDVCSVGICNFGLCEEVPLNPDFTTIEIGFCQTGLDIFDLTLGLNIGASPGGILTIADQEFELLEGITEYEFVVEGLLSNGAPIDLNYSFEATGCSGTTGNLGDAPPPCPPVETTFRVDAGIIDVAPEGMFLGGDFQEWNPSENPMTEVEPDIWEITLVIGAGAYEYNFFNGPSLFDGEYVIGGCADNGKRQLSVGGVSQVVEFCWESCVNDCIFLSTASAKGSEFSISPNLLDQDSEMRISISDFQPGTHYVITDINGRFVRESMLNSESSLISLQGLASGMYAIHIAGGDFRSLAEKFIIK